MTNMATAPTIRPMMGSFFIRSSGASSRKGLIQSVANIVADKPLLLGKRGLKQWNRSKSAASRDAGLGNGWEISR
jgi:hypothetical protein